MRSLGPPAIQPLAAFLLDESHREFPRAKAGNGLREIVCRFPETREQIVRILAGELARHQKALSNLNGLLVGDLLELKAIEAAETIEQAFAANVIDPTVAGDWGDVREELGVTGLGIAPERSPGWPSMRERFGFVDPQSERRKLIQERKKRLKAQQRAQAKRKQKTKDRKRNTTPR